MVYTYIDELMLFVACIGGMPTECCCAIGKTFSTCCHWLVWHMLGRAPTACTIHPAPLRACGTHALCKTEIGPGFPRSRNQLRLLELSPVSTAYATCGSGCWFAEAFGADELGMLQLTGAICTLFLWIRVSGVGYASFAPLRLYYPLYVDFLCSH